MSDLEIIELFKSGKYTADLGSGDIYGKNKNVPLAVAEASEEGHLAVEIYNGPKRKKIMVHRLIWLAGCLEPIPLKWELHHRNGDVKDNSFHNVVCLHPIDHRKVHKGGLLHEVSDPDTLPF